MEILTARMMAVFTPNIAFINLYNSIMKRYIAEESLHPENNTGVYSELAEVVQHLNDEQLLSDTMGRRKTLYLFPKASSKEQTDFVDQLRDNSQKILAHELSKWFGVKEVHDTLIALGGDSTSLLLQYFSYTLYSQHLSFTKGGRSGLYLTITPGNEFIKWFSKIAKKDTKVVLNLYKNKLDSYFNSLSTFVVETSLSNQCETDSFLKEHIEEIIRYEHIAWLGNLEFENHHLKWPSNLNQLHIFKEWFNIHVYEDILVLS